MLRIQIIILIVILLDPLNCLGQETDPGPGYQEASPLCILRSQILLTPACRKRR